MNSNGLCALKVKIRYPDECGGYCKCYKLIFKDYDELIAYQNDINALADLLAQYGIINDSDSIIVEQDAFRVIDVDESAWQARFDKDRPHGLTWDTATCEQRMKYIAKYLNQHPNRTQFTDPVYPCIRN